MEEKTLIIKQEPSKTELFNSIPKSSQSADTFFHFLNKIDYLVDIIENKKMYPRFCVEDLSFLEIGIENIAIAMKCFCDIPLHNVKSHRQTYGNYCIGFTKEWGIKNGLQPLIYCNPNSKFKVSIKKAFETAINSAESNPELSNVFDNINDTLKYIKIAHNYYDRVEKEYDFTDEKEWRYVPDMSDESDFSEIISDSIVLKNKDLVQNFNNAIKELNLYPLQFDFDDVKYLFVNTSEERDQLINVILATKHIDLIKYRLISKISVWEESEGDY